ncbi:hypothetical protein SAMN05444273_104126 [Litoreibacter ascidiaceicola]|uniref:Lipoprotein n=1 Tax=Litoreibacter ascidiaceicola TaxID=1486859 RepID=A0A1M4ZCW0_9RHOB|nr:hypothetical protein [Litoreibacter ascidiaceicola]SHF15627.1 hypothetical protein SAMN05444273_104126 [Litoreibacter ascidiaceicola]
MRHITLAATALALAACSPFPETTLPFFGDGYRAKGDLCRRIGEDDFTNQFLDDAADLVGCPADMENLGVFVTETGAKEVALIDGYRLYSVPRR